jgi:hypothetical protein
MKAVAGELLRRNVVPEVAGIGALRQEIANQVGEVLLRAGDVLALMKELCRRARRV